MNTKKKDQNNYPQSTGSNDPNRNIKEQKRIPWDLIIKPPNVFTFLRILIVPLLIIFMYFDYRSFSLIAAILFTIAALSDIADGYYARKMNVETLVGKFLDPLADKLVIMTALVMMIPTHRIPAWLVVILLAREFIVTGIRGMAAGEGLIIAAGRLGKAKTICQFIAILLLILKYEYYGINTYVIGLIMLVVALIFSLWSAAEYLKDFFRGVASNNK